MSKKISRRKFLGTTALTAGLFTIVPRHVLGGPGERAPSDTLYVAGIGTGGQAMFDLGQVDRSAKIAYLCDVDQERAALAYERWPEAGKYKDFRVMLEKEAKNFDAVVVATPDHIHAVASIAAIEQDKHVYVEKPMAHNIHEVYKMLAAAERHPKVVTQMGNQGRSFHTLEEMKVWVDEDLIGPIREVHCWTNRPRWPQGIERPTDTPPVPETLDWDLWLGPAQERPYHPAYVPRNWRGWWDFGAGALGDMGCHILDGPYYCLDLSGPCTISADSTGVNSETGPESSTITYAYPARGEKPPVKLYWYDGDRRPERPEGIGEDDWFGDNDGGQCFIGEKGIIVAGTYSNGARIYPESLNEIGKEKSKGVPRIRGHQKNWVDACMGEAKTSSPFSYAAGLTEMVLIGNVALRAGQPIEWNPATMKIPNLPEAEQYLGRDYRSGWEI